ncbi:4Fe-4S ferredoxin [Spirochaetia bacterium]|nr:4Fe-4S ferredoxin [Spirochaetia bacterium]
MAYKITDECVNCGTCKDECPSDAIIEKDGKCWIDPDKCADCGTCVDECPSEAIKEV